VLSFDIAKLQEQQTEGKKNECRSLKLKLGANGVTESVCVCFGGCFAQLLGCLTLTMMMTMMMRMRMMGWHCCSKALPMDLTLAMAMNTRLRLRQSVCEYGFGFGFAFDLVVAPSQNPFPSLLFPFIGNARVHADESKQPLIIATIWKCRYLSSVILSLSLFPTTPCCLGLYRGIVYLYSYMPCTHTCECVCLVFITSICQSIVNSFKACTTFII